MAFNLAPFNRTAFNSGSDNIIWLTSAIFQEKVTPVIGTSSEVYLQCIWNEKVSVSQIHGGKGFFVPETIITETVSEGVTGGMMSLILRPMTATEGVECSDTIMSDTYLKPVGVEEIDSDIVLGSNICPKAKATEEIEPIVVTDKKTWLVVSAYELISPSIVLEHSEIKTCYLDITLEPGQKIIVDSGSYNVLLDNENAIWAQSGDWIDELVRETSSISISATEGVNNLTASIMYTERYL